MKVSAIFYGGGSYSAPSVEDDLEHFDSLSAAKSEFADRVSGWNRRFPCVDETAEMHVFFGEPNAADPYPDRLIQVGARGGVKVVRCFSMLVSDTFCNTKTSRRSQLPPQVSLSSRPHPPPRGEGENLCRSLPSTPRAQALGPSIIDRLSHFPSFSSPFAPFLTHKQPFLSPFPPPFRHLHHHRGGGDLAPDHNG